MYQSRLTPRLIVHDMKKQIYGKLPPSVSQLPVANETQVPDTARKRHPIILNIAREKKRRIPSSALPTNPKPPRKLPKQLRADLIARLPLHPPQHPPPLVVRQQRPARLLERAQPLPPHPLAVVRPPRQRLPRHVVDARPPRRVECVVVDAAGGGVHPAVGDAVEENGGWGRDVHGEVYGDEGVERGGLRGGPREAVQDVGGGGVVGGLEVARCGVGVVVVVCCSGRRGGGGAAIERERLRPHEPARGELGGDEPQHHGVGDEGAAGHEGLRAQAQRRLGPDVVPEEVARGDGGELREAGEEPLGLRAFADAGGADEDDAGGAGELHFSLFSFSFSLHCVLRADLVWGFGGR